MKVVRSQRSVFKGSIFVYTLGVLLLALCASAEAQQPKKVPRIGYLSGGSPTTNPMRDEAFKQGLRALGYVEGQNILIEYRWAEGKDERHAPLAAELVSLGVDVIVTQGTQATLAAKQATNAIPIVAASAGDLVGEGSLPVWRDQAGTLRDLLTSTRI
jgi:putative ABC transport system substrate-binding protein